MYHLLSDKLESMEPNGLSLNPEGVLISIDSNLFESKWHSFVKNNTIFLVFIIIF